MTKKAECAVTLDPADLSGSHFQCRMELAVERLRLLADRASVAVIDEALANAEVQIKEIEVQVDGFIQQGLASHLRRHQEVFGLNWMEVDLWLVCIAVASDSSVSELCQRARGRPYLTIDGALSLFNYCSDHEGADGILSSSADLVRHDLLTVNDPEMAIAYRGLSVADRVIRCFDDEQAIDSMLLTLTTPLLGVATPGATKVTAALRAGTRTFYIRERPGASGHSFAAAVLNELKLNGIGFNLCNAGSEHSAYALAAAIAREGALADAVVVVGPIEILAASDVESLGKLIDAPRPVFMVGSQSWDPSWSDTVPFIIDAAKPAPEGLNALWISTLSERKIKIDEDAKRAISALRLTPVHTVRAATAVQQAAINNDGVVTATHIKTSAFQQRVRMLARVAERIEPTCAIKDLVQAPRVLGQLRDIAARGRHRQLVLDQWNVCRSRAGFGVIALFNGEPDDSKRLAAEAIAGERCVDLYAIDFTECLQHWAGETEKAIGLIFDEAEELGCVLLFEEADALFNKRAKANQNHKREIAYLLERMERFDGVAILTTNSRGNIDEAFIRRLDVIVHFGEADAEQQRSAKAAT